jgi:hypothetical protein
MSALDFKQLQDAVIADAFDESKRSDVKNWITFRHAWLWDLCRVDVQERHRTVTFTSGRRSSPVAPHRLRNAIACTTAAAIADRRSATCASSSTATTRTCERLRPPGGVHRRRLADMVGPAGDGTTGLLVYEKSKPALVNDGDTHRSPRRVRPRAGARRQGGGVQARERPAVAGLRRRLHRRVERAAAELPDPVRGQVGQLGAYRPGG